MVLQLFALESHSFHQNAQKLTSNTNSGQIWNVVINYSLFGSC